MIIECKRCGIEFEAKYARYCVECRPLALKENKKIRSKMKPRIKRESITENMSQISEMARKARTLGMSYGAFAASLGGSCNRDGKQEGLQ